MCRIAGSVHIDSWWIESALAHQRDGGPDSQNWVSHNWTVNIGHCLLSIIGNQPQPLENDRYIMTYNSEWYNFKDFYPNHSSDSLAALDHFTKKGIDAIHDFNFMGAIGLYDKLEYKLHLIVDRFAQKNLYYYHSKEKFAFASSPAPLLELNDNWEIDKDILQSYWLLGSTMGCIWQGITKINASERLVYDIRENTTETIRWYEPKFQEKATVGDLQEMVLTAINRVKVSDVPIHIFLSGGIDSTLVASQFEGGKAIHLKGDELPWAKQAAERFNIDLRVIDPEETETEESLTDYVFKCGEPAMSAIIPWIVARETAKHGKVAISANGADELFFGYDRTHDELTESQLNHTYRNIDASGDRYPFYGKFNSKNNGRMWELGGYVGFDLNKTLDFASMCHGLEVRNPFLDHELVEMALSIPEKIHRQNGNKTILKNMLRKMGFKEDFLNRPKQGFSLFKQPKSLDKCVNLAWQWVQKEGFLDLKGKILNGRDERYLQMSALGFYYWYKVWKHKLN